MKRIPFLILVFILTTGFFKSALEDCADENFKKSKSIIDESASDDAESLKRDNKQSIKKDLSRIEIMEEEEEEDDEEEEEDEEDEEFKRATKLLKEASAEVDALEKELKREKMLC